MKHGPVVTLLLKYRKWLQAGFGVLLLAAVIWNANPRQLLHALHGAPLSYVIPWLFLCFLLTVVSWGLGIHALLVRVRSGGFGLLLAASFKLQVLATITPGRLGDLGLLYFLKDRYTFGQVTAVLLVDKIITLMVNLLLALAGIGVFFSWQQALFLMFFVFIPGTVALFWLLFRCPQAFFRWGFMNNLIDRLQGFRSEIRLSCMDFRGLAINLSLTVFRYIWAGISLLLILSWFDVTVPFIKVILVQAVSQLATLLPVTIMGLGVQEALHVYLFGLIGIAPDLILAAVLWGRAIYLLIVTLIYLYWLFTKNMPTDPGESSQS